MPTADKLRDLLAQGDWDKVASLLEGMDAQVAGDALQSISPADQRILFQRLSTDTAAKIVAVLPYFEAYVLLHSRPLEDMRQIVDRMAIEERLRFFDELPEETWQQLMAEMGEPQPGRPAETPPAAAPLAGSVGTGSRSRSRRPRSAR